MQKTLLFFFTILSINLCLTNYAENTFHNTENFDFNLKIKNAMALGDYEKFYSIINDNPKLAINNRMQIEKSAKIIKKLTEELLKNNPSSPKFIQRHIENLEKILNMLSVENMQSLIKKIKTLEQQQNQNNLINKEPISKKDFLTNIKEKINYIIRPIGIKNEDTLMELAKILNENENMALNCQEKIYEILIEQQRTIENVTTLVNDKKMQEDILIYFNLLIINLTFLIKKFEIRSSISIKDIPLSICFNIYSYVLIRTLYLLTDNKPTEKDIGKKKTNLKTIENILNNFYKIQTSFNSQT